MSYERPLLSTLRTALSRPTPVIHVLIGPRQVGKTTIARQLENSIGIPSVYATADSPIPLDSAWIETQWRRTVAESASSGSPVLLILDGDIPGTQYHWGYSGDTIPFNYTELPVIGIMSSEYSHSEYSLSSPKASPPLSSPKSFIGDMVFPQANSPE